MTERNKNEREIEKERMRPLLLLFHTVKNKYGRAKKSAEDTNGTTTGRASCQMCLLEGSHSIQTIECIIRRDDIA